MNKRIAVMDLGTNTFHLLIMEGPANPVEIVHLQEAVKLGEGGINKGFIQTIPFERGIACMKRYSDVIKANEVNEVRAIATSALRNAANGQEFINEVYAQTGITIEIIIGDQEAAYIYQGVRAEDCLSKQNSLIIDIGGGSVEFIICNDEQVYWKQSFEIGAARMLDKFHRTDPIPPESINALNIYLTECLPPLFKAAKNYHIENIIGSSGVFESYAEVIELLKGNSFDLKTTKRYHFNQADLLSLIEKIILSSHQERLGVKGILPIRIDMIVTASLLTRFVMQQLGVYTIIMSTNSLKEGVMAEMMG